MVGCGRMSRLAVLMLLVCAGAGQADSVRSVEKTFTGEVNDAALVLIGKLVNANEKAETTDLEIEAVIKDSPVRGKQKRLTIYSYVDLSLTTDKDRFLIFCCNSKGKI